MSTVRGPAEYYKVLWHKCNRCLSHYTSEEPHLRAYLCNECWKALPHFKTQTPIKEKKMETKGTIPAEAWILFYMTAGTLMLILALFNIMLNEL